MAYKHVYDSYNKPGRFICDTEEDINDLPGVGHVRIGSRAFVTQGSYRYVLVPSGWKRINVGAGNASGGGESGGGSGGETTKSGVISLDNNQITDPEWLREAEDGIYYGTIDSTSAYTWPYNSMLEEGVKYPVFMEVRVSEEGVKMFECHSNDGEFQSIYDPSFGPTIIFIDIAGGVLVFEDLGDAPQISG